MEKSIASFTEDLTDTMTDAGQMEKSIASFTEDLTDTMTDASQMEKSIASFTESLDETFRLSDKNWKMYSPLALAYIGDGVYELVIRTIYVKQANCQPQKLHQRVTACVSAKAQSKIIRGLRPLLTKEEEGVYRRGRNSKPYTKAKNATLEEYLEATGFEAVIGYLYLNREYERLNELVALGLEELGRRK